MPEITIPKQTPHKVLIRNLNFKTNIKNIESFLSDAGQVLKVITIKRGSRSLGFGFATFSKMEEAEKAIKELNGKKLDGRELCIQAAIPQKPKSKERAIKNVGNSENSKGKIKYASTENNATLEKNSNKDATIKEASEKITKEAPIESSTKDTPKSEISVKKSKILTKRHESNTSVFVTNLPFKTNKSNLYDLFKDYNVIYAMVAKDKPERPGRRGRSKGYGFVELDTIEEQQRLLNEFGEIELMGRPISIKASTFQKKRFETKRPVQNKKKPKRSRNRNKKQKEDLDVVQQAEESSKEVKSEDGIGAVHTNNKIIKEVGQEHVVEAAADEVKELKKEDGINAVHDAVDDVKEMKKESDVGAAHSAADTNRKVKKDDVEATHVATDLIKEVKKKDEPQATDEAADTVKKVSKNTTKN